MAAGSSSVLSSFLLNSGICLGLFLAFSILRVLPWTRRFFAPRRFAPDLELKPKRLPMDNAFGWIIPTLKYKEADIIDEAGLDTAIYLRIIYYGVLLFLGISVWCIAVVLPANLTSGEIERLLTEEALAKNSTIINGTVTYSDAVRVSGIDDGVEFEAVSYTACTVKFNGTLVYDILTNTTTIDKGTSFINGTLEDGTLRTSLMHNTTVTVGGVVFNDTRHDSIKVRGVMLASSDSVVVNDHEYKFTDFDKYSLSNVEEGSNKMWAHLVSMYVVVLYTLWLLARFNRESVLLRLMFLGNAKRGGPSHTVLCTDVPGIKTAMGEAMSKVTKAVRTSVAGKGPKKDGNLSEQQSLDSNPSGQLEATTPPAAVSKANEADSSELLEQVLPPPAGGSGGSAAAATATVATAPTSCSPKHAPTNDAVRPAASSDSPKADATAAAANADVAEADAPNAGAAAAAVAAAAADSNSPKAATAAAAFHGLPSGKQPIGEAVESPVTDPDAVTLVVQTEEEEEEEQCDGNATAQATEPAQTLRRRRGANRYQYDLTDTSLDPLRQAAEKLESGLTPAELVKQEFELVYSPAEICAVNQVQNTGPLEPLVAEYIKVYQSLGDYLDKIQHRMKLRKGIVHEKLKVCGTMYGDWGKKYLGTKWFKKVDAMDFWLARLNFLKGRILEERATANTKAAPTAFVTFNSRKSQAVGSTSLHHHDVTTWRVAPAPAPFEVVWGNLAMTLPEKKTRITIIWIVFWLMTLFFMIPVAAIQALIEVPKLAAIPVLGDIVTAPVVRQLMEAVIPGLVLKIFLAIVPAILRLFAFLSGATSLSEVDFSVVKRFFLFQVVVVFFGNILAGSFFNQVAQWVNNPGSIIPTLGKSIPMTSTFFITYLFVNGLFVKTLAFVRLPGFAIYWLLSRFAGSPRARQRLWMYQYTDNGKTVAEHTIAILIGVVFACMNPIVCLAALCYFLANHLGERYNNIYVFRRAYESGGKLWSTVYNQVLIALYIMQLTMFGLLAIKKFKYVVLGIPLIFYTIGSHISTLSIYKKPWAVTSLHDAADLDEVERKSRPKEEQQEEAEEVMALYKNPCFKLKLSDLEQLEAQAVDVRPRADILNTWLAELKKAGKKPKPGGDVGKAEEGMAGVEAEAAGGSEDGGDPQAPPEVTKFDNIPELDGTVTDEAHDE